MNLPFRKILLVIPKGSRQEVIYASINSTQWQFCIPLTLMKNMRLQIGSSSFDVNEMKDFSNWILSIGDGSIKERNGREIDIQKLDDMLIMNSSDSIAFIIDSTYTLLLENVIIFHFFFQHREILAPTNDIVSTNWIIICCHWFLVML